MLNATTWLALVAIGTSAVPAALASAGDGLTLTCAPPTQAELRCDFRVSSSARPLAASASIGTLSLAPPQFAAHANEGESVALLLLVEQSLLANAERRSEAIAHVTRLLDSAPAHHRFGLAVFGGQVLVLAPIGSTRDLIVAQLTNFEGRAGQQLLYRSVVKSSQLLVNASPRRKALVMIARGVSDDQQLDHQQAVREARNRGVVVYSFAYPDATTQQGSSRLERLSIETGGAFQAAAADGGFSDTQLAQPFAGIDNTGALSIDLSGALGQVSSGEHLVTVSLDTASGSVWAAVPVYLAGGEGVDSNSRAIEVLAEQPAPSAGNSPSNRIRELARRSESSAVVVWGLAIVALVLIVVLTVLVTMLLVSRRRAVEPMPPKSGRRRRRIEGPADAFVVLVDGDMSSHSVNVPLFTIGRMGNNDLVLEDPSVSRHHAEIRCARDGSFAITDLESMNGIYVNGRRVRGCALTDGDELEIGDVRLSFELRVDDPLDRDATAAIDARLAQ